MATGYTREWIQFFTGCGIPDDVAAMYALIFYENRIQKNMLLDLNKEYLRDMGITVMGDVIAILRHAKIIHEKYLRAQIMSVEDNIIVEKNNSTNESSPGVKKTTTIKRILEHYTRKYNSPGTESVNQVQVILPNKIVTALPNKGKEKIGTQKPLKKKIQISNTEELIKEKGLEVPLPKVRRVLPENEGGYKIKMPLGTTERSKKLLEQAKKRKAKTVFDRLGESSVSSTTSEVSTTSSTSSTPINREKAGKFNFPEAQVGPQLEKNLSTNLIDFKKTKDDQTSKKTKNSSVFSRLGEKTSIVSSTSSIDDSETAPPDQLQYSGILKPGTPKKNLSNKIIPTMRADEQQQSEVSKVKKTVSVKKRLGVTTFGQSPPPKRTTLKAVRRKVEGETNTTSNKVNSSQTEAKSTISTVVNTNLKVVNMQLKPKTTSTTTTQIQKAKLINLKRKMSDDSDVSPLKKVRFGRTTHRLIPASPSSADPVSYVKNYPKLTMIISNRENAAENNTLSSGIRIGSLNSDNLSERLGVKARIGNKFPHKRPRKQTAGQTKFQGRKASTVKDRLG